MTTRTVAQVKRDVVIAQTARQQAAGRQFSAWALRALTAVK